VMDAVCSKTRAAGGVRHFAPCSVYSHQLGARAGNVASIDDHAMVWMFSLIGLFSLCLCSRSCRAKLLRRGRTEQAPHRLFSNRRMTTWVR